MLRLGGANGRVNRFDVLPVNAANHIPAIGFEALGGVVGKPAADVAVD